MPPRVFLRKMLGDLDFEDYRSASNLARAERLNKVGAGWSLVQRNDLARYCWTLSSKEKIESDDLYEHVSWLAGSLQPGFTLKTLASMGFEYGISAYWGGGGTGGGPLITPRLSELLVRHDVNLDIGFYFDSEEEGND
jgi:hypothetical protein